MEIVKTSNLVEPLPLSALCFHAISHFSILTCVDVPVTVYVYKHRKYSIFLIKCKQNAHSLLHDVIVGVSKTHMRTAFQLNIRNVYVS